MQIKTVLKKRFNEFNDLLNDPNYTSSVDFDVNLPNIDDKLSITDPQTINSPDSGADNINDENNIVINIDDMNNSGKNQSTCSCDFPVSVIAQKLCKDKDIIDAFQSLYLKYIDDKEAPFMINISYQNRKQLKISLDKEYYTQNCRLSSLSTKSLLLRLVFEMDQAAYEISELMVGSFVRFQASVAKK